MNTFDIVIEEDRRAFVPGEILRGRAIWMLEKPAEYLELSLFWQTSGYGTQDMAVAESMRFERPGLEEEREFALTLPEGPYSFRGKLITIGWYLELTDTEGNDAVQKEIILSPTRQEIVHPA